MATSHEQLEKESQVFKLQSKYVYHMMKIKSVWWSPIQFV